MRKRRLLWLLLGIAVIGLLVWKLGSLRQPEETTTRFARLMTLGQGHLEREDATNAVAAYSEAVRLAPESTDAHLNLANALLLAGRSAEVIEQCQEVLKLDPNSAAAYYLKGCAHMRLNQPEAALQAFQESQKIDPAVTALDFQLGLAHERQGQLEDAIREFETVLQFEPEHPSANYQLSRLYQRANRPADAAAAMARHQAIQSKNPTVSTGPSTFERSKYTQPRVLFVLEQPDKRSIPVRFTDATKSAFGEAAASFRGPIAVLDYNHDGRNSLFVKEGPGFRLLDNQKGKFTAKGDTLPGATNAVYRQSLVGDLNNDRFEDVIVLGMEASHAFRFATNGQFREVTAAAGLKGLKAMDGIFADLDFTGRLDLLAMLPEGLKVYRNLGNFYFQDATEKSGLPAPAPNITQVAVEDWANEDVPGVILARDDLPPVYYAKQRAGNFVETNLLAKFPAASALTVADFNNDLRQDMALVSGDTVQIVFAGQKETVSLPLSGTKIKSLFKLDYDNDGWLDLVGYGSVMKVWRNAGKVGFIDSTEQLGLSKSGPVDFIVAADFDGDSDTDLVCASDSGVSCWSNDGGNANKQLKLQMVGNRSNASALGVRVELAAGNWHAVRTIHTLPVEIGVGRHSKVELLKTRWFDLATTLVDVPVESQPVTVVELTLPTGSCPYLYAWDGKGFRFVTDILGAAPLGLPVSKERFVEADPDEYLALGDDAQFVPRNGRFEVRITEELREILYLDHAWLISVDHPPGTSIHPTSKMMPSKPFPPHELWTLEKPRFVRKATRSDALDVTEALHAPDKRLVGPVRIREPQLRGLAEPFSVVMDFGPLDVKEPLVLVLDGWLRFGGGMANVAASLDPSLPFPFPVLEAELPDGKWAPVPVAVGVPAGKTKTILVDLEGKLPENTQKLRWTTAFELYLDSANLSLKAKSATTHRNEIQISEAELRWHGFGRFAELGPEQPLTPLYDQTFDTPAWLRTPSGWCTRYGAVDDLLTARDNAMVLLNGGDEVALSFAAEGLPAKPAGWHRDFFLYVVGWDKDADFHVGHGWQLGPLPFFGMEDQRYGAQPWPSGVDDRWASKYNTRWVGPLVLKRGSQPRADRQ